MGSLENFGKKCENLKVFVTFCLIIYLDFLMFAFIRYWDETSFVSKMLCHTKLTKSILKYVPFILCPINLAKAYYYLKYYYFYK